LQLDQAFEGTRAVAGWVRADSGTRNPTWLGAGRAATWLRRTDAARLSRIVEAMRRARGNGVPCPEPVHARLLAGGAALLLAQRLPGAPAARLNPEMLAVVLAAIHGVPIDGIPPAEIGPAPRFGRAGAAVTGGADTVFGHFDLFPDNVLVEGGRVCGVVDWEFAGAGPRVLDVAIAALGASAARPGRARADLEALAAAYEAAAGVRLDRAALTGAYLYAAALFAQRRAEAAPPRPAGDLSACAAAVGAGP